MRISKEKFTGGGTKQITTRINRMKRRERPFSKEKKKKKKKKKMSE